MNKPVLHIADVLRWADAHHDRTGEWPETRSGELFDAPNEKWANIDRALREGCRGFAQPISTSSAPSGMALGVKIKTRGKLSSPLFCCVGRCHLRAIYAISRDRDCSQFALTLDKRADLPCCRNCLRRYPSSRSKRGATLCI